MAGVELTYTVDKAKPMNAALDNRNTSVTAWVQKPAVYMPQVLAIAEECLILEITPPVTPCTPPTFSGPIPDTEVEQYFPVSVSFAGYFTGSNLVFSASNLPDGFTIDPTTGIVSGIDDIGFYNLIQITATNACGSVQSNEFYFYDATP
jgi:hypothetical protein